MTLLSQAEYARQRGVSRASISQWKSAGKLVLQGDSVDVEKTDARLRLYRRDGLPSPRKAVKRPQPVVNHAAELNKSRPDLTLDEAYDGAAAEDVAARALALSGADMTLEEARRLKENYLAKLAQLEYDVKSKRVVEVSEVVGVVGAEYAVVRSKLLAIPSEQAPRLKRCRTTAELQDTLREIITRVLEALSADKI